MREQASTPRTILSISVMLLTLVFSVPAQSEEEFRGRILKVNGDVHIINEKGERRKLEESRFLVRERDTIITDENGTAVVRFNDGSMSVMSEKSRLRVQQSGWLSHLGGKIYFTFRKVFGKPKKVRTGFATIGIRGTTFIITDDGSMQGVALQEGLVDVESLDDAFEIHRQRELSEFEAFKQQAQQRKQQMLDEFQAYKQQTMQEFVEYKKQFTLEPNKVIRFDGKRVDEDDMNEDDRKEFDDFEAIAGEMLRQFREQSDAHREAQEQKELDEL